MIINQWELETIVINRVKILRSILNPSEELEVINDIQEALNELRNKIEREAAKQEAKREIISNP